jgi:hypothetical protein
VKLNVSQYHLEGGAMAEESIGRTLAEGRLADLPPDFNRLFRFRIVGIEVTQAIQYYSAASHLTDPADRGADNAVRLIAGKPAWVRVYVRGGLFATDIPGVTGTLEVSRRKLGFFYGNGLVLPPQPPGIVTARSAPPYATERGTLAYSLNFIVPADSMCGHLRFRANIQTPAGASDAMMIFLDVTFEQRLRLAGIMVSYNGPASTAPGAPNLTLAAPTLANLQTCAATTLNLFPVRSAGTYRTAGSVAWTLPLTDAPSCPGCCTPNWIALNTAVDAQRTADGNRTDVLYYGLMAPGIPMGPIIGCNTGGVSTGSANDGMTMAHELGHACGLPHAPCGTPGDPNYPAYEPYDPTATPQASIGEYGLNVTNGSILSPTTFKDMMAYCGPRWISLYNYGRLTNNAALDPRRVCEDHIWWSDYVVGDPLLIPEKWLPDPPPDPLRNRVRTHMERVISILGVMHGPGRVEVTSVMRVDAEPSIRGVRKSDISAQLVDVDDRVVSESAVHELRAYACGTCGCKDEAGGSYPLMFQAFLADIDQGTALRLMEGGKVLWQRSAPKTRPRVSSFTAKLRRQPQTARLKTSTGLILDLAWEARCASETESAAVVQWSADRGNTWYALGSLLRGGGATLEVGSLPSGRIDLRLLVSDGFYTALSKMISITIPMQPLAVSIMSPQPGGTVIAGQTMRLWGAATTGREHEDYSEARVTWAIDGKKVTNVLDGFVTVPREGRHRVTLEVVYGRQRGRAEVDFESIRLPSLEELGREE